MIWNTDCGCFTKILNNLISNAFKYTPPKGDITVTIYRENETLYIKVYNTGKGISRENIPLIFNRYSVLDDIQENTVNGLSSRNGLGLAICHSMTELLQGKIDVESEVDKYVRFTVSLPLLQTDENKETVQSVAHPPLPLHNLTDMEDRNAGNGREPDVRVLVIDDNSELLWIVKDTLSDEYLVTTANNGETGLQMLKQSTPDLIITDIMMPGVDGISLTRQLKQNRHTMHIPLIILSAKNTAGEKVTGIESGADAYIPKPFDPSYLKAIVKHLIQNRKVMEEYYTTSASAYNFANGQLIEKEAKDFLQSAVEIIHENIDNHEFLPRDLADRMKVSLRNLYRRFNELNLSSPKDFIKEQRIRHAAKLLLTTTLTIQEIMYRSGFTNRSHFYREFAKRFDSLTPKEYRSNNKQKDDLILK
jgi:CheY-like chemotaxis protein